MAKLALEGNVQKTIAAAKGAEKGPEYFVALNWVGNSGNTLQVAAEGAGGWDEALKQLQEKDALKDGAYVFLRKDHKVEMAKTVKFAVVEWFPAGLKAMRRMALQQIKPQVLSLLKPLHVELQATDLTDVNQTIIDDKIGFGSGTKSHVKDGKSAAKKEEPAAASPKESAAAAAGGSVPAPSADAPKDEPKKDPPAKKEPVKKEPAKAPAKSGGGGGGGGARFGGGGGGGVKVTDQKAFDDTMKEVRDDKKNTNWIVASYTATDTLTLIGSGTDGFTGMIAQIEDSNINFALLRVTEVIDNKSKVTKFVYIRSVPPAVKPMKKGEISTRLGAIEKIFGQSHVQFDINLKTELTEKIVMDKVGQASGSKSNVTAGKAAQG
jgi:hypothetical protein